MRLFFGRRLLGLGRLGRGSVDALEWIGWIGWVGLDWAGLETYVAHCESIGKIS